jgi:hypothetical protein
MPRRNHPRHPRRPRPLEGLKPRGKGRRRIVDLDRIHLDYERRLRRAA